MKKKLISAVLTVVMVMMMLTAMCPGVLAATTSVDVKVGETYNNVVVTQITSETDLGLVSPSAEVVTTYSETQNGITLTAALSADKKAISITYSGTPQGNGTTSFTVNYSTGGNSESLTVIFNVAQQKTQAMSPEIITATPDNLNLTYKKSDDEVVFTVEATGNGTISYRWRVDGTEVESGNTFTLVPADMTVDKHTVECVASNTVDDTTKHSTVTWTVTIEESDAPVITSTATAAEIEGTGSVSFEVTATGNDLKYQWYLVSGTKREAVVDGTYGAMKYSGATTAKLTVSCTMAPKDASTKFICEVTNAEGITATTEEYALHISEDPDADKVQSIEVTEKPTKMEYVVGETLDQDGMIITVITGKGEEEISSGFVCSPLYLDEVGTQTITVSYGGQTTTFKVTVTEAPHEHKWSEWKVDDSTSVRVYRECIAGDNCTAKEILTKENFIEEYPLIAEELGLTDDSEGSDSSDTTDAPDTGADDTSGADDNTDDTEDKDEKKSGNGILWAIIIIALILLAAVIAYYMLVYRKPYKKPNSGNTNKKR